MTTIKEYFSSTSGKGVLSTSDSSGNVDSAVYAKPHFMEDGSLAFIMRDRLTHANLTSNPKAAYLFIEDGKGYKGKRFFLKKIREEENSPLIEKIQRRNMDLEPGENRFLVFFEIIKELPLIGSGQ